MSTTFPMSLPHAPTGFVNQAALDTAFTTPINDLAAQVPPGFIGESSSASTVTLAGTTAVAGLATYTFTLPVTTRVKITVMCRYRPGATAGRLTVRAGSNSGSSAVIGSFAQVGAIFDIGIAASALSSGTALGTQLLTAGQYTAYASVARTGGTVGDLVDSWYTLVEGVGFV